MDAREKRLYSQAALAYAILNCGVLLIVGTFVPAAEERSTVLLLPSFVLIGLLAFWIHYGTRWLTLVLAAICGLRAAHHLFNFVMPSELYWSTPLFANFPLADGSSHPAYLLTGAMLGTAAWFLGRAALGPPRAPGPATSP